MRNWMVLGVMVLVLGCGGNDDGPPPSPEGAVLVFPEQDSECTTGIEISETQSQVTFEWQPSKNTDRYTLTVINLTTNRPQAISTINTSAVLSIEKGAPFSWSVMSSNAESDDTATSESWLFYNAGAQTTYAPFPAQVVSPEPGSTVQADADGQVVLSWTGADVEDDITTYEIYFSEINPPTAVFAQTNATTSSINVNVDSEKIYYWKVVSIDEEGNTSDSGVFEFRIL